MPPKVLLVHSRDATFVDIDRKILGERYEVRSWAQPGRVPNLPALIPAVIKADLVVGWFAHWHTFFPITLAWLLRKPSVMIIGGFDVANMPDIGYGHQRGGLRRWASRWIMRRAIRLVTNSRYSLSEIERNTPIDPDRVTVLHHGVPDPFGELPAARDEHVALTVGTIDRSTLEQKGHRAFVEAARHLPDVRFLFVGAFGDDAIDELRDIAPENVEFTGRLPEHELLHRYRLASVYVQASRHEGFGLAVAEAMLGGCVPVVMNVTAMPEVVGDAGVLLTSPDPEEVARGVRRALELGPDASRRARDRILEEFPLEGRRRGLLRVTEETLGRGG
jgi:glycosyltransferase involved in cell wall biosynthesis